MKKALLIVGLLLGARLSFAEVLMIPTGAGPIRGVTESGLSTPIKVDALSGAVDIIPYEHHEVHEGNHFSFYAANTSLAAGTTMQYLLVVPAGVAPHLVIQFSGSAITRAYVFEGTTHSTSTAQATFNNNRNSATTANMTVHAVTIDGADGTLIDGANFGSAAGAGAALRTGGGEERADSEWVLRSGTKYLVRIVSGTDTNNVMLKMSWYEP